jgi:hypothetical protein
MKSICGQMLKSSRKFRQFARSPRDNIQTQNFPRLAFDDDFKRPAAHFAIRCEVLRRDARVNDRFKRLAAKGALNDFGNLHAISS